MKMKIIRSPFSRSLLLLSTYRKDSPEAGIAYRGSLLAANIYNMYIQCEYERGEKEKECLRGGNARAEKAVFSGSLSQSRTKGVSAFNGRD